MDAVPAEERKKRPLFGIPMSIKECFKVKGIMENTKIIFFVQNTLKPNILLH